MTKKTIELPNKNTPESMFIDSLETFVAIQEVDEEDLYAIDDYGYRYCTDEALEWELKIEVAIEKVTDLINDL